MNPEKKKKKKEGKRSWQMQTSQKNKSKIFKGLQ